MAASPSGRLDSLGFRWCAAVALAGIATLGSGASQWLFWRALVLAPKFGDWVLLNSRDFALLGVSALAAACGLLIRRSHTEDEKTALVMAGALAALSAAIPPALIVSFMNRATYEVFSENLTEHKGIALALAYAMASTSGLLWFDHRPGAGWSRGVAVSAAASLASCCCVAAFRILLVASK